MTRNLSEKDLSYSVKEFLQNQDYTVHSEVAHCDITAIKDDDLVVVELKKNLSINLLTQAVKRQKFADAVYLAVLKPAKLSTKWNDTLHLLRRLELGLLLISFKNSQGFVEVAAEPQFFDREKSRQANKKKRSFALREIRGRFTDLNVGGSTGSKLMTAYRESALFIACCLDVYGKLSPNALRELGTDQTKTTRILYNNHYGWFKRVKRGIYDITELGKQEILHYPDLVTYYKEKISNND